MKYTNEQYMTKIFQFLQKKLGITAGYSTFSMEASQTNMLIWSMFMSSSMKAAIHLGQNYLANLEVYNNTNFEERNRLRVRLLRGRDDQAIKWTKAKLRLYSDSVLCGTDE